MPLPGPDHEEKGNRRGMGKYLYIVAGGCTLCGTCAAECPESAVVLGPKGAHIDQEKCSGCGICYRNCASEAIEQRERNKEDPAT
jgi:MinD superfamily P-loop ATPase